MTKILRNMFRTSSPTLSYSTFTSCCENRKKMKELKCKRFSASARAPVRSLKWAAGCDLFSNKTKTIKEYVREAIKTDIGMTISKGTSGRVAPRLSLALKHQLRVRVGVINSNFVGKVKVIFFNHSTKP